MSVLSDIAQYIQANGLGTMGVDLVYSEMPDSKSTDPPKMCALISYPGMPAKNTFSQVVGGSTGTAYEQPRIQVRCRDKLYDDADRRANQIHQLLLRVQNMYIGGVWYLDANPMQSPFDMGRDRNRWPTVGFNVAIRKDIAPPT